MRLQYLPVFMPHTFFIPFYRTAAADVLLILFPVGMVGQLCPMLMDVFLAVEVAAVGGLLHSQIEPIPRLIVRLYMHAGQQIPAKSHDLFRQDFSFRYFKTCCFMARANGGVWYDYSNITKNNPYTVRLDSLNQLSLVLVGGNTGDLKLYFEDA